MDDASLKAVLSKALASNWSLDSDFQLQLWLQNFSNGLVHRTDCVAKHIHKLVEETSTVEQELQNTFNHFRSLSNSQFIENRVYEEDETSSPTTSKQLSDAVAESYEDGIIPRYKEAVLTAWRVLEGNTVGDNVSISAGSGRAGIGAYRPLPFVIGTEEYLRDAKCGLTESDSESNGTELATDIADKVLPPEAEWSDSSDVQAEGLEPAVSAALDFKAMLEAALRGPSVSYAEDEGSVSIYGSSLGFFGDTNTSAKDPRSLDLFQRTMSENREQSTVQDYQQEFYPLNEDGTRSTPLASGTQDVQNVSVATASTSTANGKEERRQEPDHSQFEFPPNSKFSLIKSDDDIQKFPFVSQNRALENSSALSHYSPASMEHAPLGSDATPWSVPEPTVPDDIFRGSQQSRAPGTLSGKSLDSKGAMEESAFSGEDGAQYLEPRSHDAHRRHSSPPTIQPPDYTARPTSSQVMPTNLAVRPSAQQLHGGLFDDDEDDSYIAQLMRQKNPTSNQNRGVRLWGKVAAGKGLFDKTHSIFSNPEDQQVNVGFDSGDQNVADGDYPVFRTDPFVGSQVYPVSSQPITEYNSLGSALGALGKQPAVSEDDTLSWSSTDEGHTGASNKSLHEGVAQAVKSAGITASPFTAGITASPFTRRRLLQTESADGNQNTSTKASRVGTLPPTRPSGSLVHDSSSSSATQIISSSNELKKEGTGTVSSEAGSDPSLRESGTGKADVSSRQFSLFGDDDNDDGSNKNVGIQPGGLSGQDSTASDGQSETIANHFADRTGGSVSIPFNDGPWKPFQAAVSTDSQGRAAEPRVAIRQADTRLQSMGSAYLSSILFGDDEETEDELFGSFSQGPAGARSSGNPPPAPYSSPGSSKGRNTSPPVETVLGVAGSVETQGTVGLRRRSLFDD